MRFYKKRAWMIILVIFVAVASFTFLTQKFKDNDEAQAANPWAFDPGYIISDWQMGNFSSMSEAEIQAFLTRMNPCGNRDYGEYVNQTNAYGHLGYSWHWGEDHFVCLSEERFGDGMTIGSGDTAAHIIWQTAQDYRINPQVLLVLLEKENGLVTDLFPNNRQYRTATGFGCPDTAACDSQYFGFKNQLRQAAALFREVLDGGWTNYPLGNNYVQYNPNAACGGTVVNIRNRATSALYRYTPYQPNASALAAGYGVGDGCGAYGNRNFYLYFEDWFGGITRENGYVNLSEPRDLRLKENTERINPDTGEVVDILEAEMVRKYTSKLTLNSGEMCLRTERSTILNNNECIPYSNLGEVYVDFDNPRYMKIVGNSPRINSHTNQYFDTLEDGRILKYVSKINKNGMWYYRTEHMTNTNEDIVMSSEYIRELEFEDFKYGARYMRAIRSENLIDPYSGEVVGSVKDGQVYKYGTKMYYNGVWYYRTEDDRNNGINKMLISDALEEMPSYEAFITPREMILAKDVDRINPYTGEYFDTLEKGRVLKYTTKIYINNQWYYRTEHMTNLNEDIVVPASAVDEIR